MVLLATPFLPSLAMPRTPERSSLPASRSQAASAPWLSPTAKKHCESRPCSWNLDNLPLFDPDAVIASPRSIEACNSEGIMPAELAYKPLAAFEWSGLDNRAPQLRHDFFEARRQDLLAAARAARAAIVVAARDGVDDLPCHGETTTNVKHVMPCARLGPASLPHFPATLQFLQAKHSEYSRFNKLSDTDAQSTPPRRSTPKNYIRTTPPPSPPGPAQYKATLHRLRSTMSGSPLKPVMMDMIAAPRSNRVEEDAVRFTENHLGTKLAFDAKMRRRSNDRDLRIVSNQIQASAKCMQKCFEEADKGLDQRQYRELMAISPSRKSEALRYFEVVKRSKACQLNQLEQQELERCKQMELKAYDSHTRKERVLNILVEKKSECVEAAMQSRVRWRHEFYNQKRLEEARTAEVERNFDLLQERIRSIQAASDTSGVMRKELEILRDVGRKLNVALIQRKEQYLKAQSMAEKDSK